jgi:hypothetical protein
MNKINISDDAMMQGSIDDLRDLISSYSSEMGKELLRTHKTSREQAVTKIDTLVRNMTGLV